jgi:acetyl esterase/lipase
MGLRTGFATMLLLASLTAASRAADPPAFTRVEDVIYGRKYGTALTLDVFTPRAKANGAGVIWVVSGGFVSSHDFVNAAFFRPILAHGYTVFAVVHGSQPRYTVPEILQDMHRAVRFIRHHAKDYSVDPNRIGIMGASAGGHLALMQGTAGERGWLLAQDPVERESSRVQAVACFCPATDFLNFGKPGERALGRGRLAGFRAPFDFHELDKKRNVFVPIVDEAEILKIGRAISPVYHVSKGDAPTLILHGDKDPLVPIQQSELMVAKLKEAGVEARLVVKPGALHNWPSMLADVEQFADWFDRHLAETKAAERK